MFAGWENGMANVSTAKGSGAASVQDIRNGQSPGGVVPAAPPNTFRSVRCDPVEHQPGGALQAALIKLVEYQPGNKAKLTAMLRGGTAQLRFEKDIKPALKRKATTWQAEAFVAGATSSTRKQSELKTALTEHLNKVLIPSDDVRPCAVAYIEKKYGKETGKLQFEATKAGGVFPSKGTTLPADLIRSGGEKYFMMPEKFNAKARTALADKTKVTLRSNSPVLYKNANGPVRVALQVTPDRINYVAAEKFNTPEGAEREHGIVAALQARPVSKLRETAKVGNDATYLFTDLAVPVAMK
jgi:hypothetical protein